jgi:Flp pilus assembly protein TadD
VSGLVQVGKNVLADRFMYLPQIGFFIVIVWSVAAAVQKRGSLLRPVICIGSVVLLCLGIRSSLYVQHWKDSASIFAEAAAATEGNSIAHANAAYALARKGALKGAIAHYRKSLEITPGDPDVRTNLGAALSRAGQSDAAVAEFTQVLRDDPGNFGARLNIATHLIKERQPVQAIAHLHPLLEKSEDPYLVNYWLGRAWADAGDKERATTHYQMALRVRPADARATTGLYQIQSSGL